MEPEKSESRAVLDGKLSEALLDACRIAEAVDKTSKFCGWADLSAVLKAISNARELLNLEDRDDLLFGAFMLGAACHEVTLMKLGGGTHSAGAMVEHFCRTKKAKAKAGAATRKVDAEVTRTIKQLYNDLKRKAPRISDRSAITRISAQLPIELGSSSIRTVIKQCADS